MAIRLSGTGNSSVLAPTNKALTHIAQARIDTTVARAVARHEHAIRADGSDIYLWLRSNAGLICTCRQPANLLQAVAIDPSKEGLRNPNPGNINLPVASENNPAFKLIPRRGVNGNDHFLSDYVPPEFAGVELNNDADSLDTNPASLGADLKSLTVLNTQATDAQLATMLSEGAAVYGGDKTACGICFGTGRTHGYDLITGKRLLLDASNEFTYTLNNASIKPDSYPAQFRLNCDGNVTWLADLPSYTKNWLNFTIRDNLQPASGLILEFYYRHQWLELTVANLVASEGYDRSQTPIRVRMFDQSEFTEATFTHAELIYSTTEPLVGQSPPLNYATNFEVNEPIITTEFEILAQIADIPRESVFQDSKYKYLWKVLDVTPRMTAHGQVFGITLNARMVHRSEALYALKVIFDPLVTVNDRGLEIEEGGLEIENINPADSNADIRFTLDPLRKLK